MVGLRAVISWLRRFFNIATEVVMAEKKEWEPTWLYTLGADGEVFAQCFVDGPPEDAGKWHDSPGAAKPAPKKRGRPRKEEESED